MAVAHNSIRWQGLEELRAQLRRLPADLRDEAAGIMLDEVEWAEEGIEAAYPVGPTGNLKAGLQIMRKQISAFGAGYVLINRAPHAWLYEHGSQTRKTGWFGSANPQPARPTFIPRVMRARRRMYDRLKGMLQRHGLHVIGDAA